MYNIKSFRGFNLIELMIAMLIGLILLVGVYQLMISSKRTYNVQGDLARMQEGARFALDFLGNDLRMTGYFGCMGSLSWRRAGPALGRENGVENNLSLFGANNTGLNGSDIFRVAYMDTSFNAFSIVHCGRDRDNNGKVDNELANGTLGSDCKLRSDAGFSLPLTPSPLRTLGQTTFTSFGPIRAGERVVVADCGGSDAYLVSAVAQATTGNTITITPALAAKRDNGGNSYGAELRRFVEARYFIGANNRGGMSLFKQSYLNNAPRDVNAARPDTTQTDAALDALGVEEVIEGVENLQLRYGLIGDTDRDGSPDVYQYFTADAVPDWRVVRSIQITLLMRTVNERFDMELDTATYALDPADGNYNPPDDYLRRAVFKSVVMLRNNN